jgi:uncharacterized protein
MFSRMDAREQASDLLVAIAAQVQERFANFNDPAHGWEHVSRVYSLALRLAEQEQADPFIVGMAALLHDVGRTYKDPQRHHAERSAILAAELLAPYHLSQDTQDAILHAILAHSYRRGVAPRTLEARVVYDADRLDSLGASGILRWAMAGAVRWSPQVKTYHPSDPLAERRLPEEKRYLLDRFFTKLLKLDEVMTTTTGREMAQKRIQFFRLYLEELKRELEEGVTVGFLDKIQ